MSHVLEEILGDLSLAEPTPVRRCFSVARTLSVVRPIERLMQRQGTIKLSTTARKATIGW
jgi:hypothetical protein